MSDVVFGGTLRFMLQFGLIEKDPVFTRYVARLDERPAFQRAEKRNADIVKERGIKAG